MVDEVHTGMIIPLGNVVTPFFSKITALWRGLPVPI